ncbi:MAG: KpsF/GutQ family sugar-phosphate isomerase [Alphaproteobacteria bacterium]|nr:KpsF/GutQ family sugar-phosphate isomerase [Alphaproteobacteria bacterium]
MPKPLAPPKELAQHNADIEAARAVLTMESDAVLALADSLDARFAEAVSLLSRATGRVIVTGMGKSGHVARKIAATLASTGAPSHYVHPAEASHGDLGMITAADVVLALSNSGETKELSDLLQHCRRFTIPLLAITGRADSTLAQHADVALITPDMPEAGTMGLAPTTSTTVAMALGDALAVALLERSGFTASDFGVLHPGGKLGRQLLRVSELMHTGAEMPLIEGQAKMSDALIRLTGKRFGCIGVVDPAGAFIGMITDGDLRRHMGPEMLEQSAAEIMTKTPMTVSPDDLAMEVLARMNARTIVSVFAVEDDRAVGILHLHDMIQAGIT